MTSDRYGYSVAQIRGMETTLLTASDVDRIARADLGALSAILQELGLIPEGVDAVDSATLDDVLEERLDRILRDLKDMVPDPELFDLFIIRRDISSIETILKAQSLKVSVDTVKLGKPGLYSTEDLKQNILTGHLELLGDPLKEMTRAAITESETAEEPMAAISRVFDREYLTYCKQVADNKGGVWFKDWAIRQIDIHNIDSLFRAKTLGIPKSEWEPWLVDGGTMSPFDFRSVWPEPLEVFAEKTAYTPYGEPTAAGVAGYKEHGDLIDWDRAKAEFELRALEGTRTAPNFSPGHILLYWLLRKAEVRLIRTVATAKRLNRSRESILRMTVKTNV